MFTTPLQGKELNPLLAIYPGPPISVRINTVQADPEPTAKAPCETVTSFWQQVPRCHADSKDGLKKCWYWFLVLPSFALYCRGNKKLDEQEWHE